MNAREKAAEIIASEVAAGLKNGQELLVVLASNATNQRRVNENTTQVQLPSHPERTTLSDAINMAMSR